MGSTDRTLKVRHEVVRKTGDKMGKSRMPGRWREGVSMNQGTLSTCMKFQKSHDISKFYKRVLNLVLDLFYKQQIALFSHMWEKREREEKRDNQMPSLGTLLLLPEERQQSSVSLWDKRHTTVSFSREGTGKSSRNGKTLRTEITSLLKELKRWTTSLSQQSVAL